MPYYLGIDGGGSKTTCAVSDDNSLLAKSTAGPSNVVRVGEAQARESLHQSVRQACAAAGINPNQIARTCIGAAGAARANIDAIVRRLLAEILATPVDVVGDATIALEAAFGSGPGVIVIAGTGSIACGRDTNGTTARAGGWGFAVSDEGSAHWIGRVAIGAALHAIDPQIESNGKPLLSNAATNPLLAALMKSWGVRSLDDLVRAANSTPAPDFSALFPVVVSAAESGDEIAQSVLTRAGTELADLAYVVISKLFPQSPASNVASHVPLAMVGGVFRHAPPVREVFYNQIRRLDARAEIQREVVSAVEGALALARKVARVATQ